MSSLNSGVIIYRNNLSNSLQPDNPFMFEPDLSIEEAYRFSRFDRDNLLSTASPHELELENERWTTAEHYLHLKTVVSEKVKHQIRRTDDAKHAFELAKPWYRSKVKNWKNLRRVLMTRALYTKAQMYPEVKQALLEIQEQKIVEVSLYDHYWGIGRDQRGENMLGVIWMDIRNKIRKDEGIVEEVQ